MTEPAFSGSSVASPAADATTEPLNQLQEQIARFYRDPYLLTVTADNRPRCGTVTVQWDASGRRLIAAAPSSWPGSAQSGYCQHRARLAGNHTDALTAV